MQFESHGIYKIEIINNQLRVDATGPFNGELGKQYKADITACIKHLSKGAWNQIITLHETSLCTPESEVALISSLKERMAHGLYACALVLPDGDCKHAVEAQFSRIYTTVKLNHRHFDTIDEAANWLNSLPRPSR